MSSEDKVESATRRIELKRRLIHRYCSEFKGAGMIAELNRRYRQKQALLNPKDEDIMQAFESAAYALRPERSETRSVILDCIEKTNFDGEEKDPVIRQYMMEDLEEQNFVIHILREDGVEEDKLPKVNVAFARLNAIERKNGREQRWSDNDEYQMLRRQVHHAAIEYRSLLNRIAPTPTIN